jgi:serine/threonine-protein kinase
MNLHVAPLDDGANITQMKRYGVRGLLGEGGMGWVYRAYDPVLRRDVALKTLKPDVPESERKRFRREAIFGARFCHPSIARVFDLGAMPPHANGPATEWFTMEYLPGEDMEDVTMRKSQAGLSAPLASVLDVFRQILGGLQYAHECSVVHRDVKPANMFVTRDPNTGFVTAKLLDFGVSLDLAGPRAESRIVGDPRYIAPEQTRLAMAIGGRADIYAAGISLYEVLTGIHPFEDMLESASVRDWFLAQRERPIPSLAQHLPQAIGREVAQELDAIVAQATAKLPCDRFPSARAMQTRLVALARHC